MLKKFKPSRVYPWYRSILLPAGVGDIAKMMLPALLFGVSLSIVLSDVAILLLSVVLGYIAVIFLGGLFAQYEIRLTERRDLDLAIDLLDSTPVLVKSEAALAWQRRAGPPFLKSEADKILISQTHDGWLVRGKKYDIFSLAVALSRRATVTETASNEPSELR